MIFIKKEILESMLDDTIFCNKELSRYILFLNDKIQLLENSLDLACDLLNKIDDGSFNWSHNDFKSYFIQQAKNNSNK